MMALQSADNGGGQQTFRRPKLLFLARPFPLPKAVGSVRTWNTAKYLSRKGWDVTVVTPHPSIWRRPENPDKVTAETEREGIRCILTVSALRGPNIAVVITSVSGEERLEDNGMIPAKIYESLGLGNHVLLIAPRNSDGVVLVLHGQKTTTPSAQRATERLDKVGAPILGVILNGIDIRHPDYIDYRSYYSSYSSAPQQSV